MSRKRSIFCYGALFMVWFSLTFTIVFLGIFYIENSFLQILCVFAGIFSLGITLLIIRCFYRSLSSYVRENHKSNNVREENKVDPRQPQINVAQVEQNHRKSLNQSSIKPVIQPATQPPIQQYIFVPCVLPNAVKSEASQNAVKLEGLQNAVKQEILPNTNTQ